MMKKFLGTMLLTACVATTAFGGTVTFMPEHAEVMPGESATFGIHVSSGDTIASWDAISILVGSDTLAVTDMAFSTALTDIQAFDPFYVADTSAYDHGIFGGIFLLEPVNNLNIGTVTLDTDGLSPGSYDFYVDSDRDTFLTNVALGLDTEGLSGHGSVTVIPEPATLGLLGLGGLAALLRRRQKA